MYLFIFILFYYFFFIYSFISYFFLLFFFFTASYMNVKINIFPICVFPRLPEELSSPEGKHPCIILLDCTKPAFTSDIKGNN